MSSSVRIGVDLGGTRLRLGVVEPDGTVTAREEVPSLIDGASPVSVLVDLCRRLAGGRTVQAVGVAASGPLDVDSGRIDNPYTLPDWSGVPLRRLWEEALGPDVEVHLENDTAAAALGESLRGAGRGADPVAMVTVGTGIGAALVSGGRLLRGSGGFHPEAGHCLVDPTGPSCYCGSRGCWEVMASGTALARNAEELGLSGPEALVDAARAGDRAAETAMDELGRHLARGLISLASFWAPEVVVLGGSVVTAVDLLRPSMDRELGAVGPMLPNRQIQLVSAALGADAGLIGAALMTMRSQS